MTEQDNTRPRFEQLRVGEGQIPLRIISEPYVILTFRGYAPVVDVLHLRQKVNYTMYIQAKSLAEQLEEMRRKNDGEFIDLEFLINKASSDRFSAYVIERLPTTD